MSSLFETGNKMKTLYLISLLFTSYFLSGCASGSHTVSSGPFTVALDAKGQVVVESQNEKYVISSRFSTPQKVWSDFGSNQKEAFKSSSKQIALENQSYTVTRTLTAKKNYFEVQDVIELLPQVDSQTIVGIQVHHQLMLPDSLEGTRLNGFDPATFVNPKSGLGVCGLSNQGNSSLFAKSQTLSIGILPLDDVFSAHAQVQNHGIPLPKNASNTCNLFDKPSLVLRDVNLALSHQRKNKLEMKWAIYPQKHTQASVDSAYYDFVNAVRSNTMENYTIDGPVQTLTVSHPGYYIEQGYLPPSYSADSIPDSVYREVIEKNNIKIILSEIPLGKFERYAHGSAFPKEVSPVWIQNIKKLIRVAHDLNAKVLIYMHPFISTERGAGNKYAQEKVLNHFSRVACYPTSQKQSPTDNRHLCSPNVARLPLFIGTKADEGYGKKLMEYVHYVMQDLNADGIYMDESSKSVLHYSYDDLAYQHAPDPYSAELIYTFQTKRQISNLTLATSKLRMALIDKVYQMDGIVIANTSPITQTFKNRKMTHFTEMGTPYHAHRSLFHTPVGLTNISDTVQSSVYRIIENGLLPYFTYRPFPKYVYPNITESLFPFKPVYMQPGILTGADKFITTRAGVYGWDTPHELKIYKYNTMGIRTDHGTITIPSNGKPTKARVSILGKEIAVVQRGKRQCATKLSPLIHKTILVCPDESIPCKAQDHITHNSFQVPRSFILSTNHIHSTPLEHITVKAVDIKNNSVAFSPQSIISASQTKYNVASTSWIFKVDKALLKSRGLNINASDPFIIDVEATIGDKKYCEEFEFTFAR